MGNFLADFYSVNGLVLESRKRREHLSEEDILRNKAIMESLSKGGNLIEQNFEVSRVLNMADCHSSIVIGVSREKARPPEKSAPIIITHYVNTGVMEHHITNIPLKKSDAESLLTHTLLLFS